MASQTPRSLGLLHLERGLSLDGASPGSLMNPATFHFPILLETVEGAWADRVIQGDPGLEAAYIAAARRLIEQGAVAISSTCGFSIRHQAAVAASVEVPVATSSLLLLPMLLRQLPRSAKIGVVTADSRHCTEDMLGIDSRAERARIVIGGIEGGELWRNEMQRPPAPTDTADIEADVALCVARLRGGDPEIAALLFECTAFPLVKQAIRQITRLPIYDIVDLCRIMMASVS
ncbi:hypothetical protein [Bradyrhizobium sp. Tv2a-2]|uniref:hypothetical protein n=1 Tax=Bradyrhizobium sp. Tv2a-2 TaxID=113395 RepID=UPI000466E1E5|nr:hypothetical protein [Bradyrhizobium sp. Tv2a-2]